MPNTKQALRKALRIVRDEHVAAQPASIRALLFNRPPAPLMEIIADEAAIGLYSAHGAEAPTASYAKFFLERGHRLALPVLSEASAEMQFAAFTDPFEESDLVSGPFGIRQPSEDAQLIEPDMLFVPLLAFTLQGDRLGQGGGHYDRWLAAHPGRTKVGLAWDAQLVDELPVEAHDQRLDAIVTPTRLYGPFS
ncbi:5-formyltetrahydrofolate cyclo-ligase [Altererythrobacter sp.]|nr:5-formyltetrahydrofolate cyclo-ligase [Altererythrobacter sp.]